MKLLKKILLVIDLTKGSDSVIQMTICVAKSFDSEVLITNLNPDVNISDNNLKELKLSAESRDKEIQEEFKKCKIKVNNVPLDTGDPVKQIIKLSDISNANLIMMGAGGNEEYLEIGNTTQKIIQNAIRPVWAVRDSISYMIKKILCPINYSSISLCALKNAIHFARRFNAELSVLKIAEPSDKNIIHKDTCTDKSYIKQEQIRFDKFLANLDFSNVKIEKKISGGKPYEEILKTIYDKKTDLLFIDTISSNKSQKEPTSNVMEKILKEVPCSIMTFKSRDAIQLRLDADDKNIEECFNEGKELIENGFCKEASLQLQHCIDINADFKPAWEYLSIAYERLGKKEDAESCKKKAKLLQDRNWEKKVTAEIRGKHTFFDKKTR